MKVSMTLSLAILLVAVPALVAVAQHGKSPYHDDEESSGGNMFFDASVTPLVIPTVDDFLPPADEDPSIIGLESSPIGFGGYIDVTGDMKLFTFAPWYTFSDAFSVKVRVPWIFQRTLNYFDWDEAGQRIPVEAKAGGLGDISLDAQYTHRFATPARVLRLQGSVKLPTGDDEKKDGDWPVPLGTGSVDLMARAQYTQTTRNTGLLVTGLYRRNNASETIQQGPTWTNTTRVTNGHQFVGAVFGRYRANDRLWVHLGSSLMLNGDGEGESVFQPTGGAPGAPDVFALDQKSTLVDLFPGFSFQLGPVTPYLGVRIPVVTSYDKDYIKGKRDTAITLQVSYRPERLQ